MTNLHVGNNHSFPTSDTIMNPFVQVSIDDGIAILRLNHPETRNALGGPDTVEQLVDAVNAFGRNPALKAVIVTGTGPAFCSGGNLTGLADASKRARQDPAGIRHQYLHGIQEIPLAFERLDVPTIAAVNGPAMGAGCDLACMCDIRIAGQSARFAESFIKLGIVPGDGGAWLLAKVVGLARAYEMSFTGDTIDADEALRIGLVTHMVADDELMAAAMGLARRIASNPAPALRMTKRLIREGIHSRLDSVLQMSAAFQALAHHTDEHAELVSGILARQGTRKTGTKT